MSCGDNQSSMRGNVDCISSSDLPQALMLDIVRDLGNFSVALFGVSTSDSGERLDFVGSGTLVRVGDYGYILSAAHVWTTLRRFHSTALTLFEQHDQRFLIATQTIEPSDLGVEEMNDWGPWGPDIVFLRVPSHHVGTIEAYKVFYNLSKRRSEVMEGPPELDMGAWLLMGAPKLEGEFTQVHASLRFPGYFSRIMQVHTKGDLDYLDIGVDLSLPGLPGSFGGTQRWRIVARSADKIVSVRRILVAEIPGRSCFLRVVSGRRPPHNSVPRASIDLWANA